MADTLFTQYFVDYDINLLDSSLDWWIKAIQVSSQSFDVNEKYR